MDGAFRRVAIIGLGLMGGSFGKSLLVAESREIKTYDPGNTGLEGMIPCQSLKETVTGAELVVLASPIGSYPTVLKEILPHMEKSAVLLDLGSVKSQMGELFKSLKQLYPERADVKWAGGHPMCGSEKSGSQHSKSELFQGATFFLTEGNLDVWQRHRLEAMVLELGATPSWVSAKIHDHQVARTSHLPHLCAAALVRSVCRCKEELEKQRTYMAGGFKDSTRIAAGSEGLWKDILLWNRDEVLDAVAHYEAELNQIKRLIREQDEEGLETYLKTARLLRQSI